MATKTRKEYCEDSRSRVDELFESTDDIVNRKMSLTIYGEKFTFDELQAAMLYRPPFIKTKEVSSRVDLTSITKNDVDAVRNALEQTIPRTNEPCLMQWVCAKKFKEVAFFDSEMKSGKLFPPRMSIDVGTVAPNSSVRVNTGYVLKMPSKVEMLDVKDGKIVKTGYRKQPSFVVVPHIVCEHDGFIPTVYARDPEDTGLFTVNFTTTSGVVGKLRVVFKAYRVVSARNQVSIVDSEQSASTVFKPKDQNVGRLVNNPKPKIVYESMRYEEVGNRVLFKTYDSTQKTLRVFPKQQLCVERLTTLIVSRKREWDNDKLVTLSGVFVPGADCCVAPKVAKGSEYNANTHCLAFVDCRLNLFSARVTERSDVKVVNGAFCDTDAYADVSKAIRKIISALNGLGVGVAHCKNIASRRTDLPLDRLIRLMDYHKTVLESDDQLKDKCFKSDKDMYDSKPSHAEAYSVDLYRAFRTLVSVYFASRFSAAQIEELKLSKNSTETAATAGPSDTHSDTAARSAEPDDSDATARSTAGPSEPPDNDDDDTVAADTDSDTTADTVIVQEHDAEASTSSTELYSLCRVSTEDTVVAEIDVELREYGAGTSSDTAAEAATRSTDLKREADDDDDDVAPAKKPKCD